MGGFTEIMKRLLSVILVMCMIISSTLTDVRADDIDRIINQVNQTLESVQDTVDEVEQEVEEIDKPMGSSYEYDGKISRMAVPTEPSDSIGKGVDISKWNWQKADIDFKTLAKNVDFVIIRCGYGGDLTSQDDAYFVRSVEECEKYGIPYGVYLYSYATSVAKAKSEAQHTLRMLDEADADPDLPVFLDMEDDVQAEQSAAMKGDIAETYCDIVEAEGYTTGVYANKNWWENHLTDSYFDNVIKWVAQYNSSCTYKGDYAIWQCTSSATVDGITGVVDLNYMIQDTYVKPFKAEGYSGIFDWKSHTVTLSNYKPGTEVLYSKDKVTWSTTKPKRKKVGVTTVYYKATAKDGSEIEGSVPIEITAQKIAAAKFSSISNQVYTGKQIKPKVTATYAGNTLVEGKDFTIEYGTNKSTGKGTVIFYGKGNFKGRKTLTFYIVPKKVTSLKSSKGSKKKSAVIKWSKATGSSGYRIAYSRKGKKDWHYVNVSSTSKAFTGLSVKTYDVKVRAYITINGEKEYGAYSDTKTMTAK